MAWNIVIAGGGFGGAAAARELERAMPRQSARLVLVNETNFALYTPFLPEAAAGTLEPRHVVTPLREILNRTYLRLGSIVGHDPEAQDGDAAGQVRRNRELPYDQLLLSLGSVSRVLPVPGLAEHAVGFKSLADAIYLRNHVIETLEEANATEDPARREQLLTYVFVGGGYAGLEALAELQDFAADAMETYPRARLHGMRWVLVEATDRVLPEIDRDLGEYALRELRGRGIDIRLETTLEEVGRRYRTPLQRRGAADPDRRLDRRRRPAADPQGAERAARRARPGPGRLLPAGAGDGLGLGDRRLRRGPGPERRHLARRPPRPRCGRARWRRRNIAAELGIGSPKPYEYRSEAAFVNLGRYKAVGKIGDRTFRGFPAWWMARTYHMSQIPGSARKVRAVLDWTAGPALPPRPLRGRLDRPPETADLARPQNWLLESHFCGLAAIRPSGSSPSPFPRVRGGSTRGGICPRAGRGLRPCGCPRRFRRAGAVLRHSLRAAG